LRKCAQKKKNLLSIVKLARASTHYHIRASAAAIVHHIAYEKMKIEDERKKKKSMKSAAAAATAAYFRAAALRTLRRADVAARQRRLAPSAHENRAR